MSILSTTILLSLLAFSSAQVQPPVGPGQKCLLGGFRPIPCKTGLICVLSDFGNPAADGPRVGKCTALNKRPPTCTISYCTTNGANALCATSGFPGQKVVATCRAWAKRTDTGGSAPNCNLICTEECLSPRLVASNGMLFCNLCKLQAASCKSHFEIFGPVKKDKCTKPISPFDAAECCIKRGIGCLPSGARCSTIGSQIRPVPCQRGLTCVITDFGFPAVDRPNSGICRFVKKAKKCSIKKCTKFGANLICKLKKPTIVTTCKAWAKRDDGTPGPNCNFPCPRICNPPKKRPLASNGIRYCTLCVLRSVSCRSDFMIFGPVKRK